MTPGDDGDNSPVNLIASDLFFGLGAVILVAVAALSVNVRDMVARVIEDRTALAEDTVQAAAALAATAGPVLLADEQGLHRLAGDQRTLIALDDLWADPQLQAWLGEGPLLVIAPSGQDTAFLTFSRAAGFGLSGLVTVRLTQDCRTLRVQDGVAQCSP